MFSLFKKTEKYDFVIDKSAVVDQKILKVIAYGFISGKIAIAKCVYDELSRSERARDKETVLIMNNLIKRGGVKLISELGATDLHDYLKFCKLHKSSLITLGEIKKRHFVYNNVKYFSVEQLSKLMSRTYYVGDKLELQIIKKGKGKDQGVGFLCDGSIVVVKNGEEYIGRKVEIKITGSINTSMGTMYFGDIAV